MSFSNKLSSVPENPKKKELQGEISRLGEKLEEIKTEKETIILLEKNVILILIKSNINYYDELVCSFFK